MVNVSQGMKVRYLCGRSYNKESRRAGEPGTLDLVRLRAKGAVALPRSSGRILRDANEEAAADGFEH